MYEGEATLGGQKNAEKCFATAANKDFDAEISFYNKGCCSNFHASFNATSS